ncbi:hypothetical protein ACFPVV_01405 [Macrococcoides bohemicum]|uniref:DUF2691 family protein n=1 Tax=Macrococcoides bohemicum TaxID=1903056 RepID=A0A328A8T1_9STAP|nr:hypothetical protein [Macrococcus bohemicus]RAK50144.1 hypothetical protein BHX94_01385 [Macrococcus bohemicus]
MKGFILNEGGFVTYPFEVFKHIEEYVKSLKWKIYPHEHNGDFNYNTVPFDDPDNQFIDGETLYLMLEQYSDVQWIWGVLSGFPNEVSWEEIIKDSKEYDITDEQPYYNSGFKHIENKSVFELIAMDSSRTIILIDDEKVQDELLEHFPKSEKL